MGLGDDAARIRDLVELTSQGDIAALPSGFTSVGKSLRTLAATKRDWRVELLDADSEVTLDFEGKLKVRVPKGMLKEFTEKVFGEELTESSIVSFSESVCEAAPQATTAESIIAEITAYISGMMVTSGFRRLQENIDKFRRAFDAQVGPDLRGAVLRLDSKHAFNDDLIELADTLRQEYQDDPGSLEMILSNLQDGQVINTDPKFRSYTYLMGTQLTGLTGAVPAFSIVYRAVIDFSYIVHEEMEFVGLSGTVGNTVLDKVRELLDVKVVGRKVYPAGLMFRPALFAQLTQSFKGDPNG